jgi:DNA-binding response OmpR family regulator
MFSSRLGHYLPWSRVYLSKFLWSSTRADRITGIQAGADDFLTKPVDEAELVARIATALKLKHTVDRRLGEFSALKDQVAQLVRFVTLRDSPAS